MAKSKRPRLGRGLSGLMANPVAIETDEVGRAHAAPRLPGKEPGDTAVVWIQLDRVRVSPFQPRRGFDEKALDRLAASIRSDGLLQPVIVRPTDDGQFELVAGERRLRAASKAGIESIPAIVRSMGDRQAAEWALVENLQREDLNAMERAEAFARLADQFSLTHEQIADRVGITRSAITNFIRLMDLDTAVQDMVRDDRLSAGHARALLGLDDPAVQVAIARKAIVEGWSVRRMESAVAKLAVDSVDGRKKSPARSAHYADIERQISGQLNTKVRIRSGRKKNAGTLMIEYYDLDQFDAILQMLGVKIQ